MLPIYQVQAWFIRNTKESTKSWLCAHDWPHAVALMKTITKTAEEAQSVLDSTELWL